MFDPTIGIPIAIFLAIWIAISEGLRWRFLGLLIFIDLVMPFIFMMTMLYHRQISEFDIRKREQRIPLYVFAMMCHLAGAWLASSVGKTELAAILTVFWILGAVFTIVTYFWKISLHGGVNAVLIMFINVLFGWSYWYLFAILPIVGWARVAGKHHTWPQYIAGAVVGGAVSYLALHIVGY